MAMPQRFQRSRVKGRHLPPGTVVVTKPTRWANPFPLNADKSNRAEVVAAFRAYAEDRLRHEPAWLEPLRGRDLACYCRLDEACHAEVLLELANR